MHGAIIFYSCPSPLTRLHGYIIRERRHLTANNNTKIYEDSPWKEGPLALLHYVPFSTSSHGELGQAGAHFHTSPTIPPYIPVHTEWPTRPSSEGCLVQRQLVDKYTSVLLTSHNNNPCKVLKTFNHSHCRSPGEQADLDSVNPHCPRRSSSRRLIRRLWERVDLWSDNDTGLDWPPAKSGEAVFTWGL